MTALFFSCLSFVFFFFLRDSRFFFFPLSMLLVSERKKDTRKNCLYNVFFFCFQCPCVLYLVLHSVRCDAALSPFFFCHFHRNPAYCSSNYHTRTHTHTLSLSLFLPPRYARAFPLFFCAVKETKQQHPRFSCFLLSPPFFFSFTLSCVLKPCIRGYKP